MTSPSAEGVEPDPRRHPPKDTHLRRWGAVYLLAALFIGSWLGQFVTQLQEFRSDQAAHGEPFVWGDYWYAFLASTFENWQSEWLQLVFQAILLLGAKHLIFRADARDLERIEAKIDYITDQLEHGREPQRARDTRPSSQTGPSDS